MCGSFPIAARSASNTLRGVKKGCPSVFVCGRTKMFGEVVTLVALAWPPVVLELLAVLSVSHEPVVHFC